MKWFAANGDKVLSLFTGACAIVQAAGLYEGAVVKWLTVAGAIGTLAHTIFFPNTPSGQVAK